MAMKYYKKMVPKTPVLLPDNTLLKFETVDQLQGYFATDVESLQAGLLWCMRNSRGGVSEITPEEFQAEFLDVKKNGKQINLGPGWREEITGSLSIRTRTNAVAEAAHQVVAVKPCGPVQCGVTMSDTPVASTAATPVATTPQPAVATVQPTQPVPEPKQEWKPRVGRRPKKSVT